MTPVSPIFALIKRILRYIKGTMEYGLTLSRSRSHDLIIYSDANWAGCPDTRRSTSGYCVFLGDNLISWSSKRQNTVSQSSAAAKYRGVANVVAEAFGFANSWASFIILYHVLLLFIVTTSVPCICQQTHQFITKGPNTWKSISILSGSVWPLALCGFYMFLHPFSMPTYLLRDYQLLSSSTFDPVSMFDHLPVETAGGY